MPPTDKLDQSKILKLREVLLGCAHVDRDRAIMYELCDLALKGLALRAAKSADQRTLPAGRGQPSGSQGDAATVSGTTSSELAPVDDATAENALNAPASASRGHEDVDVIGEYSGVDHHRWWWSGGTWLRPGDEVVVRRRTEGRGA